ncbi:superoxide dismutase [Ignavibacteria bacterium CHB1]|jgi:Fe-Mn family superoxide dismutase|nr:MAG: superoxide dismutase [Chlorobiota bacterium]KXK05726.1 MAG: Manganese-dependent superoxide dismutase [Chlorobi bacterium OLB4]MBV6398442.1 hypothetical protein [Ignavibacteria bacterium]MCC6885966.1 superoxide dismutase [Ignavibacteriales bacterium]MCE7952784.1 superoxide dismutase [Chlorobi bacterium CHB7]MDL1886894.1 superoxide dismutase [Ignavibacteria bacterium CHB1]OQY77925.1 MAG: hypothetical protein B6D43_05275 [Ignavibacteriales bacterium UTCHB1]RIK50414.1 MAG: hypothetical p
MSKRNKSSRREFIKRGAMGVTALSFAPGIISNLKSETTEKSGSVYEWKFAKRPYSDAEAEILLSNVIDKDTANWHYNVHQKGYVTALNKIESGLQSADRSKANGNYSEVGELKRRFTWNHAGALLHEIYWDVIGGDGDPSKGPEISDAIVKEFGSMENWRADFKAAAVSAKLSGWGVLAYDLLYSGRLINVLVDEHHYGAIWGGIPIIPCDVFEHAYYHKDGPARGTYIDNFIDNLHWGRINDRFKKFALK